MTDWDLHDDDELPPVNPFRPSPTARILRLSSRLLDAIRFWLLRPPMFLGHLLAEIVGRLTWGLDWISFHLRSSCQWCWWRALQLLRVDRVQRQLRGWQQETSQAIGDLGDSVAARTTRGVWLRRLEDSLRRGLQGIHLGSLWLQAQLAHSTAQSALIRTYGYPFACCYTRRCWSAISAGGGSARGNTDCSG